MNSQIYNKDELYPEDFTEEDKLQFDMYLEQSKLLFPKMANDIWALKMGIKAYMRKVKSGSDEQATPEEIAEMKSKYTNDTVFYTEPIEVVNN
jgi:hypothetical protein